MNHQEFRENDEESHRRNTFLLAKAIISLSDGFKADIEQHLEVGGGKIQNSN